MITPRGEQSLMFRRMKGRTEGLHPQGITSPLGADFIPGGQISPKGHKAGLRKMLGKVFEASGTKDPSSNPVRV
jgi:hypothetical protein